MTISFTARSNGLRNTLPNPERSNLRLARQRQLPVKTGQHLAEDVTSLGLAGRPDGKPHRQQPARLSPGPFRYGEITGGQPP
jgi:hypothetical protein